MDAGYRAATEVVSILGVHLKDVLKTNEDDLIETVEGLRTLLNLVLYSVMKLCRSVPSSEEKCHPLCAAAALFFGKLTNDIVIPIATSFWHLSIQIYANNSQKMKHGKEMGSSSIEGNCTDLRAPLLNLVRCILQVITHSSSNKEKFRHFSQVILCATLRELSRCCSPGQSDRKSTGQVHIEYLDVTDNSCRQRITRLARKDTIWYLCNVASPCLYVLQPGTNNFDIVDEDSIVTLSNIVSSLSAQITRFSGDRTSKLSSTERGLIMALLDRILASS